MRLNEATILGLLICWLAVVNCDEQRNEAARQAVVHSNNAFSTSLYQALSSDSGNLAISPLSAEALLAMAWLGAGGETASQLATGLHLPESRSQVEAGFKALLSSLQGTPTVTLDVANKMYIRQGSSVKSSYRQTAVDNFRSDVEEVDFANNAEAVRTRINEWVEEKTRNKIKNLIQEGSIEDSTLLILVNAVYFKGGWRNPFNEFSTFDSPFSLTSGSSINVSTMHQTDLFRYGDIPELNAKALQMFYRGKNDDEHGNDETQSMLLLLPNEADGLASLEANITSLNLTSIINSLAAHHVYVSLPRFKVKKTLQLKDALQNLGITSIFAPGADLTGVTDENVYVNKILQKVFVEVTEKGTEAAASTYLDVINYSAPMNVKEFQANHPFLFLILDDTTGTILFMGRVANPK